MSGPHLRPRVEPLLLGGMAALLAWLLLGAALFVTYGAR